MRHILLALIALTVVVSGCTSPATPEPISTHLACVDLSCTTIDGAGTDTCATNADCSHLACAGNRCLPTAGAGSNACQTDADCAPQPETHLACVNEACTVVTGAGTNSCTVNSDCKTHLECIANTCTSVPGAGNDACTLGVACGLPADGPDLKILSLTSNVTNADMDVNFSVRIDVVVGNIGNMNADNSSTGIEIVGRPVLYKFTYPLYPDRSRTVSGYFDLPAGTYTARAVADAKNIIVESDEQNTKELTFEVR